jgi:hypothetical protein
MDPRLFRGVHLNAMLRFLVFTALFGLVACSGPRLPPPNSAEAAYDPHAGAIQVTVSGLQPASQAALVAPDGSRYPASGFSVVSQPHVLYNPPPSLGIGIGGFGLTGCCSAFGSGAGVGIPLGRPTVAEVSDQYVTSALIAAPADYATNWARYRVEILAGNQSLALAAPAPAT